MKRSDHKILAPLLRLALLLTLSTNLRAADVRYETGSLINLATVRGVKATASDNLRKDYPPAELILHRAEAEIRYDNNFGPCWWMMQLPSVYNISDLRLNFRDVITSVSFQIKVAEQTPADWNKIPPIASFKGPVVGAANSPHYAELHFNPVKAKLFRIEFIGQNGGENGAGSGHQDLVISGIQVWGPNDPPITPAISIAQSAWAGGQCTVHDCTTDTHAPDGAVTPNPPVDCPNAIDDNEPGTQPGEALTVAFFARGSPAAPADQTDIPASFVVTLKNRARVVAVAYAAPIPDHVERPRDIKLYTSSFASGDEWTPQKEVKDIQAGDYEEIAFDQPVLAQRVRFDIERVWNPKVDPQRKAAEGHISELYVYAESAPPDIEFTAGPESQASCQIFDTQGKIVRNLRFPQAIPSGSQGITWDGLDDLGNKMPPGEYQARLILNPTIYTNIGNIGNTALPPTINQNPTQIDSVAADSAGNIYTADVWDEAAQDFRKWDRDTGQHVFDAHGQIRNGNPNGLAYAIAVDDKFIYCATTSHTNHAQQHLRRFHLSDGQLAPFPAGAQTNGHILIHDRPDAEIPDDTPEEIAQIKRLPLHSLAVVGGKLFVTDALAGKILIFDKETGAALGSFDVNLPQALAADSKGQLWVAHEEGKITIFSQDGTQSRLVLNGHGHIPAIAFGPDDTLYIADSTAGKISIFPRNGQSRTFGQPSKPGDYAPDLFNTITALTVDAKNNLTVATRLPVEGSRLTKFAPDGNVIWDQVGGEFCDSGNTSVEHPDEVITQFFHRYIVNKQTGKWEFRGSVLDGDPQYIHWPHGAMRIQKLGNNEFIFQGYGDGLQVYRRNGDLYRLCAMFGSVNPLPKGIYRDEMKIPDDEKPAKRLWSWHDANGNGKVDDDEIDWESNPGEPAQWDNFGINVDKQGNALVCEFNNTISEVPVIGFDKRGNPIYDAFNRKTIIQPDHSESPLLSDPIMAVRADDGSIYVHSRSKVFPAPPESGGGWMAGWMLARYDKNGQRLWFIRLPTACPGMDCIPGGGVMLVSIKWGKEGSDIYHYTANGELIGVTHPSTEFRGFGGIPDNTGSLCISRDPRDGLLDMFVEDCVDNHFQWYRINDKQKPTIQNIRLQLTAPGNPLRVLASKSN